MLEKISNPVLIDSSNIFCLSCTNQSIRYMSSAPVKSAGELKTFVLFAAKDIASARQSNHTIV